MLRLIRALVALCAVAVVLVPVSSASGKSSVITVPTFAAKALAKVKRTSDLPVLLPDKLRLPDPSSRFGAYGVALSDPELWSIDIGYGKQCRGSNACGYAFFQAERNGKPYAKRKVTLTGGVRGYYQGTKCGASCSGPTIQFKSGGVLYTFSVKRSDTGALKAMTKLANEALKAGPR